MYESFFGLTAKPFQLNPDPAFYYEAGGGPVFDMGPYYFTALVALLGPAQRVCGSARRTFPRRISGPRIDQAEPLSDLDPLRATRRWSSPGCIPHREQSC